MEEEEATRKAVTPHESAHPEFFPSAVHLDSLFLFQNNLTGRVSTTPLSVRQLCRILCPATGSSLRHLTPDTNLLLQEPDGSYCAAGWKPAKDVPVLQEAITPWFYYSVNTEATTTTSATVSPAVSCRALASIAREKEADKNGETVYYSSALTKSEWKTLDQLPHLQTALEAFEETISTAQAKESSQEQTADGDGDTATTNGAIHEVQKELEAFLASTSTNTTKDRSEDGDDDDDTEECYESDGGTRYVKDTRTGNWVHEALVAAASSRGQHPQQPESSKTSHSSTTRNDDAARASLKRKPKKAKFSAKKGRCWIYVTGLPVDCTHDEVAERFAKAGILDLDPETQRPKVKLYRHKEANHPDFGKPKGDASVCYARPESVSLAVTLLDGTPFRPTANTENAVLMTVQSAKFEQHGNQFDGSRVRISNAKRKVAKLATMQAIDWDEGEYNGRLTGGRKGLRIIVLKHIFDPKLLAKSSEEEQNRILGVLEQDLRSEFEQWGAVEKITFFSQNPKGVVVVKFTQPGAASDAVKQLNGRLWKERRIEACFWDGATDFTAKDEAKEAKDSEMREEEFGNWLDSQQLPEELQLETE